MHNYDNGAGAKAGPARLLEGILFFLGCLYLFYLLSGYRTADSTLLAALLLGTWGIIAFLARPWAFARLLNRPKYRLLLCFFGFYALAIAASSGLSQISFLIGAVTVLSPMVIYDYYALAGGRLAKALSALVFGALAFFSVRTLLYLRGKPGLAREMAGGAGGQLGIGGGYTLAYALCVLIPALLFFLRYYRFEHRTAFVVFFTALVFTVTVVRSDFAIAFIFLLAGCLMALCLTGRAALNAVLLVLGAGLAVAAVWLFSEPFGLWLYKAAPQLGGYIGQRLQEAAVSILGMGVSDDLSVRLAAISESFSVFLKNPLVGQGFFTGFDYSTGLSNLGQHSEWMDALGKWGLCGSLPYFGVIGCQVAEYRRADDPRASALALLIAAVLVPAGFLNPLFFPALFAVISLIIPGALSFWLTPREKGG